MSEENKEKKGRGRPKGTTRAAMEERRRNQKISESGGTGMPDNTLPNLSETAELEDIKAEVAATDLYMAQVFGEGSPIFGREGGMLPKLPGTLSLSVPRIDDYASQLAWAKEFRSVKFIKGALMRRRKFIISGFKHRHQDEKVVKLFDKISKETKFIKRLKEIQWEKDTVGWAVAWPDQINIMPKAVHLLQGNIRIDRTLGVDRVFLRVDSKLADAIKANPQGFPSYFQEQLNSSKRGYNQEIELQGAYIISAPRSIGESYPVSPMYPLFEPIKIIESLIETEYAISFAVKQLIMHTKVKGEVDNTGKQKSATRAQLATVARQVINGARTANVVTDAGVEIGFVSPDKSIFQATEIPYNQAMGRVIDNVGIPMLLVSGRAEGVSYSTATFIIKGFLQDVIDEREDLLTDFVYPWYREIAKNLYETDPKKYSYLWNKEDQEYNIPTVQFNETELKNIVELLTILKFLKDTGAYSVESMYEDLQRDFRVEKARKERQNDEDDYIYNPYEPSQGMARSNGFENPQMADIKLSKEQFDFNKEHSKEQLEVQKKQAQIKAATKSGSVKKSPSKKPAGSAGRPSKAGSAPRPDGENRNPRTESASISDLESENEFNAGYIMEEGSAEEVTLERLLTLLDNPTAIDNLLKSRAEKFFEKDLGGEDISE